MPGENFEAICIETKVYVDRFGGNGKVMIGVRFFHRGFVHNPSIFVVKIFGKEKTDFSIAPNGFL